MTEARNWEWALVTDSITNQQYLYLLLLLPLKIIGKGINEHSKKASDK